MKEIFAISVPILQYVAGRGWDSDLLFHNLDGSPFTRHHFWVIPGVSCKGWTSGQDRAHPR